jgi:hypothetical protein
MLHLIWCPPFPQQNISWMIQLSAWQTTIKLTETLKVREKNLVLPHPWKRIIERRRLEQK